MRAAFPAPAAWLSDSLPFYFDDWVWRRTYVDNEKGPEVSLRPLSVLPCGLSLSDPTPDRK